MITLKQYIDENYNGNISAFAKDNDMTRQQAHIAVSKNIYYVHDGTLFIARKTLKAL